MVSRIINSNQSMSSDLYFLPASQLGQLIKEKKFLALRLFKLI